MTMAPGVPWWLPVAVAMGLAGPAQAQIERIWLTHQSPDPSKIVVSWESPSPGDSRVEFGTTAALGRSVHVPGERTLHHVEIPLSEKEVIWHYRVSTRGQASGIESFKGLPARELRLAIVADWGFARPDLSALIRDDVHLLLTAGDNIPDLHTTCGVGVTDCTKPFASLIDRHPALFRSTPFMPGLGNHDREIRPRGPRPPEMPVYDVPATAYRRFFALPGDEWKWAFDIPDFDLRLIMLDLNHISDQGTTWQTCHPLGEDSEQLAWYEKTMRESRAGHVLTIYNERNASVRSQAKGRWGRLIQQGSLAITGFGYFAERAEVDGFPYYNTALKGTGDRYPDPKSAFLASEDNYLLLSLDRDKGTLSAAIKALDGRVLDEKVYSKRPTP